MAAEREEMLPPVLEDVWRADREAVARRLANHTGAPWGDVRLKCA